MLGYCTFTTAAWVPLCALGNSLFVSAIDRGPLVSCLVRSSSPASYNCFTKVLCVRACGPALVCLRFGLANRPGRETFGRFPMSAGYHSHVHTLQGTVWSVVCLPTGVVFPNLLLLPMRRAAHKMHIQSWGPGCCQLNFTSHPVRPCR